MGAYFSELLITFFFFLVEEPKADVRKIHEEKSFGAAGCLRGGFHTNSSGSTSRRADA